MQTTVPLNLTGKPYSVRGDIWRVFLRPGKPQGPLQVPIDSAQQLDWRELDRLPELTEIHYTGRDTGFVTYATRRQGLTRLAWYEHGQSTIDLRDTSPRDIAVDVGHGKLSLRLPTAGTTKTLTIHVREGTPSVDVEAPEHGRGMQLTLWNHGRTGVPDVVPGLERIVSLHLYDAGKVNLASLSGYRELQLLDIRGPGAAIPDIASLSQWQELKGFCSVENPVLLPMKSACHGRLIACWFWPSGPWKRLRWCCPITPIASRPRSSRSHNSWPFSLCGSR